MSEAGSAQASAQAPDPQDGVTAGKEQNAHDINGESQANYAKLLPRYTYPVSLQTVSWLMFMNPLLPLELNCSFSPKNALRFFLKTSETHGYVFERPNRERGYIFLQRQLIS